MKLSDRLSRAAEGARLLGLQVRPSALDSWEQIAQRIEADQRAAWRSFYIAAAIVGLLIAFAVWQRFDLTRPAAQPTHTAQSRVMYT